MIVKILSRGKSFKGLATYLTHDAEAKTDERVAWTHTRNLANDDVPSAVDEMLWTARNAELLKQEAGIRAGGRATENSVKHLSLNWSPDENPSREHMIEATGEFLHHMKWQEHQAILVAHDDKRHAHVHVMLNVIHPETGLRLDDNFERRRAQAWALEYERTQGRIYCEQRLNDPVAREDAPPRNMWVAFQQNEKEFENAEKSLRENEPILVDEPKNRRNSEWEILKEIQRTERTDFFAEGKLQFSQLRLSIYREVREEYRERWADFYAARRNGSDPESLATLKAELVAEQKATFDARRDEACRELRQSRDRYYRELLDRQRETRADLRWRQGVGLDNAQFLNEVQARNGTNDVRASFRDTAREVNRPLAVPNSEPATSHQPKNEDSGTRPAPRAGDDIGVRVGLSFGSFLDSLFFALMGESRNQEPQQTDHNSFAAAAEEVQNQQQQRIREEEDAERRRKERSVYWE